MMRFRHLLLASAFLTPYFCSFSYAQAPFAVGTASAAPGQKATGYLAVPAGVDTATSIPVVVVNGAKPGKVLALVSGAHGTEYASIIAIEKLISDLDPAQVTGTVILVPLVNVPSFEQKVPHVNPVDGKSINRFYPGKADGTQTERAPHRPGAPALPRYHRLRPWQTVNRCRGGSRRHGRDRRRGAARERHGQHDARLENAPGPTSSY